VLAKPEPYQRVKARKKRQEAKERAHCRAIVWALAGGRCERCMRVVRDDDVPEWAADRAHVNERVPRSRGGSPTDPSNCELLCQSCHMPNGMHAPTAERQAILEGRAKGKA
jgi:5-methylcytosine-specific restriction endonuclease McrA